MGIVTTIPEECRRCYTCVRECPVKAIKVEGGQAVVIKERCIACGNCLKVCAQNAKWIRDSTGSAKELLASGRRIFACLAPSFPAAFADVAPGKVIAAVRALGFHEVWEVAFGAELTSREYTRFFEEAQRADRRVIASPCPAIVAYIEKYLPELCDALAPVVSPMIAVGKAIRQLHGPDVGVVFIGPCVAKKNEIRDPAVAGVVDCVLTNDELVRMLDEAGIALQELQESGFDGPRSYLGRAFPISGGLLKSAGLSTDILENDIVITEGKDRVLAALKELAQGQGDAHFFDVLFCEGCINGPKMLNDLSVFARQQILARHINEQNRYTTQKELAESLAEFSEVDLHRTFQCQSLVLPQPSEEEIAEALASMKKLAPEDQLDCGACGYPTCREKAIAICQGLAEGEMCLPYIVEELEATCGQLQESHEELVAAQQRLVQSERMASMGQLSAGVAHELNNPLGTVLIYSHMLLRQISEEDTTHTDLQMIVNEAMRCKKIVRSLLDFARESRVSKVPTDMGGIIEDIRDIMASRAEEEHVRLTATVEGNLPVMNIDGDQVKQLIINLVGNGIDAIEKPGGQVDVRARVWDEEVVIEVSDNGQGIAPENLSKLFTPFFTTKELGKGTGLGLAIAYGIIKMHSGDISAESEVGKGTTFTVRLPVHCDAQVLVG
jgi:two-component system, NtrC family, sensor kinase